MSAGYVIEGHAIVSVDEMIADAAGNMPDALRHESDWNRFQAALDRSIVVVVGRRSHEVSPNVRGRRRLIVSAGAAGLERRSDGLWWNPQSVAVAAALQVAAPEGGLVAVPGGRAVFDLFLAYGFDAFHLARAPKALLPGGNPVFSACRDGMKAEEVLRRHGLAPGRTEILDAGAGVSLQSWRRQP